MSSIQNLVVGSLDRIAEKVKLCFDVVVISIFDNHTSFATGLTSISSFNSLLFFDEAVSLLSTS